MLPAPTIPMVDGTGAVLHAAVAASAPGSFHSFRDAAGAAPGLQRSRRGTHEGDEVAHEARPALVSVVHASFISRRRALASP